MTLELLIHSIVRQTTILIARLATSGGARSPLAQVADQVFFHLVTELERQGVSRRVCADMFGLGLRTYQRKVQPLGESLTDRGQSLWEAVLDFVHEEGMVTRAQVSKRFQQDDESQVRSVLRDLSDTRLIFYSGSGPNTAYRIAWEDELRALRHIQANEGLDELVWALVYRLGPVRSEDIIKDTGFSQEELQAVLARLVAAGRVEHSTSDGVRSYCSKSLVIPSGAPVGWGAAVFDHYKAMVNTITAKVSASSPAPVDRTGGCTYTLEVWNGHPLEEEACGSLARIRRELSDLRGHVGAFNAGH